MCGKHVSTHESCLRRTPIFVVVMRVAAMSSGPFLGFHDRGRNGGRGQGGDENNFKNGIFGLR